ncbi:MAG: metallophosphoesterase [Thermoplasmata archaeon]|nr:MAG: metallophosphoesterase [Thermoplasmata archaeon]
MTKVLVLKKGVELIRSGLGVYLEHQETLVIADLHIGLEFALMGEGTYLPVLQYPVLEKSILELVDEYKPTRLVINGDFKHEFARATNQEWTEILDLWDVLKNKNVELELVRGNHDNFLINVLKQRGKTISDPSLSLGEVLITHGHKPFQIHDEIKTIILAHEHPAIAFKDDAGGKHKFKCYLYGKHYGRDVIILPAFSPMAAGVPVNSAKIHRFMSQWLENIDTSGFEPIVVDSGEILTFPPLEKLELVEVYDPWLDKLEVSER